MCLKTYKKGKFMDDTLESMLKKISDLEKKLEKYFKILQTTNELDFILKGSYILNSDLENLLNGK